MLIDGTSSVWGSLTEAEITQLANINSSTISTGQWAYLGNMDQDVITTSTVTFNDITISTPSNIYSLSHDSFADFSQAEHNLNATNVLTACATNAGAIDFSAASKTLTVENNATVSQDYSSDAKPTFAGTTLTSMLDIDIPTGGRAIDAVATVSGDCWISATADTVTTYIYSNRDGSSGGFGTLTNIPLVLRTNNTDRVTIAADGTTFAYTGAMNITGTVAATTVTGANVTSGADPGHTHTGSSIGSIDISDDTNLAVTAPIVLTGDTLSHSTANGYVHTPADGASAQILQYSSAGTAKWVTLSSDVTIADGGAVTVANDSHSHTASTISSITVADTTDTTCYVGLWEDATGSLLPKTDTGITYNAGTGILTATGFAGPLTGNVTGDVSGSSGSCTGNSATATLASTITVADESTDATCFPLFVTANTGSLAAKTASGLTFDSSTDILTATGFAGPLTGNVTGNVSGSSGSCTGNAATATLAATITIADNESTAENDLIPFVADAAGPGSNALETDGDFYYTPSTGVVTATGFAGALTGNVTGNVSGSSGSCTGNAATATTASNVADADYGDVTVSGGAWAVEDDSHNHTSLSAVTSIVIADGGTIGQAAGPLLTFDDTSNRLWHKGADNYIFDHATVAGVTFSLAETYKAQVTVSASEMAIAPWVDHAVPINFYTAGVNRLAISNAGAVTVSGAHSAASYSGPLTGNVTGNVSGSSGSCTGNATGLDANSLAAANFYINNNTAVSMADGEAPFFQIKGGDGRSSVGLSRWSNDVGSTGIYIGKSRSATPGSYTIVQNGDGLGRIIFCGDDGTDLNTPAAAIHSQVNGSTAANVMPGNLMFYTNQGGAGLTQQMVIDSSGDVTLAGSIVMANGESIGQAAGPLLTFDDTNNTLELSGASFLIAEQASANGDTAGYGQIWVKNTTPCELWFTDDAGTDHQIAFV